jgi:hypothetical protein
MALWGVFAQRGEIISTQHGISECECFVQHAHQKYVARSPEHIGQQNVERYTLIDSLSWILELH